MAEPNPEELFDQGKEILDFAVSGGGGAFRVDSLEAKKYYIQAKEYFEKACNLNYAKGCVSLGSLYEGENLVIRREPRLKKRLEKAIQYYSKACDLKDGEGCFNLGLIYELNGYGVVKKDLKKAARYYSKACELDYDGGCVIFLARKDGELANKQEVFQYLSKACDLNDKFGCSRLGAMQYIGKGVVKNEKQAAEKFEKACKLGKQEACEMVTYKGLCELGHKEACEIFSLEVLCESSDQKACSMSYDKKKALGF
ncbi:tetratricopeptide repeat protein [Helicobacter pylori]|uniref:tetratricopeptide repeat protein n=1 Tax=Helicobacter pylori TaxID=210 RepID=UPI0024B89442|nr:tetratricopeptide repeat protein [Helicobacter pylori]